MTNSDKNLVVQHNKYQSANRTLTGIYGSIETTPMYRIVKTVKSPTTTANGTTTSVTYSLFDDETIAMIFIECAIVYYSGKNYMLPFAANDGNGSLQLAVGQDGLTIYNSLKIFNNCNVVVTILYATNS